MKDYSLISKSFHYYEDEKRYQKRVELSGTVDFYYLNGNRETGEIQLFDISVSGLGFTSQHSFVAGDVLELIIDIPGYISMQILCYVVWRGHCDNGYIYGSMFVSMNNLNRDIIKMYLHDKMTEKEV